MQLGISLALGLPRRAGASAPNTPANLAATPGNQQVTLTWDAVAGATSYDLRIDGGTVVTGVTSPAVRSSLNNGQAYSFEIRAVNAAGSSAWSGSVSATPRTVPGAPTIGTATAGNAQASVTFSAPGSNGGAAITGYTVTSSPGGITGTGASSPIVVTGLTNGQAYTFTVTATNAAGTGAASSASNSVTPVAPPSTPTGLALTPDEGFITASWDAAAGATSYELDIDNGGYLPTGIATTSYRFPAAPFTTDPGISIPFKVRARNAGGASAYSSVVSGAALPLTPENLAATPGATSVTLNWDSVSGATSYHVRVDGGDPITGIGGDSYEVTGLTPGVLYDFEVRAIANSSIGNWCDPIESGPPAGVDLLDGLTAAWVGSGDSTYMSDATMGGYGLLWSLDTFMQSTFTSPHVGAQCYTNTTGFNPGEASAGLQHADLVKTTNFGLSFWFRYDSLPMSGCGLAACRDAFDESGWYLRLNSSGAVELWINGSLYLTAGTLNAYAFNHIVVTRAAGDWAVYVNNSKTTGMSLNPTAGTYTFYINLSVSGFSDAPVGCSYDAIHYYGKQLTDPIVSALYATSYGTEYPF